jgi:hypothetical protein
LLDLDDLLELFELDFPLFRPGPLLQRIIRVGFGLFLALLSFAGFARGFGGGYSDTNAFFNAGAMMLFLSLALFGLLTVALGLKRMWPAWLVPISFAFLFLARVLFGP